MVDINHYSERLDEKINVSLQDLPRHLKEYESYKKKIPGTNKRIFKTYSLIFRLNAGYMIYLKRYKDYFHYIDLTTDCAYRHLKMSGTNEFYYQTNSIVSFEMIENALLSRKKKLIPKYLDLLNYKFSEIKKYPQPYKYNFSRGIVMKNLILNKIDKVKKELPVLHKYEGKGRKPIKYGLFNAIANQQKDEVIIELKNIFIYHLHRYNQVVEVPISLEGIALTLLAIECGIPINIKTDFDEKIRQYIPEACFINRDK